MEVGMSNESSQICTDLTFLLMTGSNSRLIFRNRSLGLGILLWKWMIRCIFLGGGMGLRPWMTCLSIILTLEFGRNWWHLGRSKGGTDTLQLRTELQCLCLEALTNFKSDLMTFTNSTSSPQLGNESSPVETPPLLELSTSPSTSTAPSTFSVALTDGNETTCTKTPLTTPACKSKKSLKQKQRQKESTN